MKMEVAKLFEETIKEEYRMGGKYGYLSQMSILVIKSLVPSLKDVSVVINYERYIYEMDLWMDYRTGSNPSLLNMKVLDQDIYWMGEDGSIFFRMVALLVANPDWEILVGEVIKNILFTTGNIRELFKYTSMAYFLYLAMNKVEDIRGCIKEWVINFGQQEFLQEFSRYYRLDRKTYPDNYVIEFEKIRIDLIGFLNGVYKEDFKELGDMFKVVEGEKPKTSIGTILYNFLYGEDETIQLPKFYRNMGVHLMNLRGGRIGPEVLMVEDYILPDVFEFEPGQRFFHTLLNESEVLKRQEKDGKVSSLIRTKTGIYLFRR